MIIAALFVVTTFFVTIFFKLFSKIEYPPMETRDSEKFRTYHVVISIPGEKRHRLTPFYEGVKEKSEKYDSAVDLYIQKTKGDTASFQELVDFASFSNADGLFLWIPQEINSIKPAVNNDGVQIPTITLGNNSPSISKICHMVSDFSGEAKNLSEKIVSSYKDEADIMVLNYFNSEENDFIDFQNEIIRELEEKGFEKAKLYSFAPDKAVSAITDWLFEMQEKKIQGAIIALSEADTVNASQAMVSFASEKPAEIFGFGNNDAEVYYLEKGIVKELFAIDYEKIGSIAMTCFSTIKSTENRAE